jgi:colanic acid biosynthesis glycosyl transferase WcaI
MRILIYSANFAPEPTGIGKYSGDMALWLAGHGHEVHVVAAPPYYPLWKIDPSYRRGVDVWRAPLWVPSSPNGLTRLLHLLSFAMTSFPAMIWQIGWRPDLVLTVAPAFMCAPAGLLTARLCRAQAWLHVQDFEVDVAFGMGLLKGRLLQRIVLRMERWLLRRFDRVSTISTRMVERLAAKGVEPVRTHYFPNWVDITPVAPTASASFRVKLGIPSDAIVVLFSGTLGGKQGLQVIPEAARLLASRSDIVFVVCGEGVIRHSLEAAAAALPNLRMLPLQPLARLAELLGMADMHLLPQSPDAADLVLPSKLSGMLASGRPVIATCRVGTEISDIVSECGIVVEPENGSSVAHAVVKLADDPQLRSNLGRRARAYAESNFERDAVLRAVFGHLESPIAGIVNDLVA